MFGDPYGFGGNGGCLGGLIGTSVGYGPSGFPGWGMSAWPGMSGCGPRPLGMGPWGTGFGSGSPTVVMVPATVVIPASVTVIGPYAVGPYIDNTGFLGGFGNPVVQAGWVTAPLPPPLAMGISHDPLTALLEPVDEPDDSTRIPAKPSSTAGKLKCFENLAFGDEKMRKRKWSDAYLHYRTAVNAAGDQANAHFRLAVCYVAMSNFDAAIRSFKRSVFLDPALPQTCDTLEKVFGPDSLVTRSSILNKVADWLKADIRNPDRLFLLGVLLHCEREPRSREVFEAAQRMSERRRPESREHITAFLALPVEDSGGNLRPGVPLIPNLPPLPDLNPAADLPAPDKGAGVPPMLIPPLSEIPIPPK